MLITDRFSTVPVSVGLHLVALVGHVLLQGQAGRDAEAHAVRAGPEGKFAAARRHPLAHADQAAAARPAVVSEALAVAADLSAPAPPSGARRGSGAAARA